MRRSTLPVLAGLIAFAAVPTYAQTDLGVRAGLNYSTASVNGSAFTSDPEGIMGWHAGIMGEFDIGRWFAVQFDVWYATKGFNVNDNTVEVRQQFVEIPVIWVVKYPSKIEPHLMLGAVLSLETGCQLGAPGSRESCTDQSSLPIDLKGADTGILFGGGVKVPFGPGYGLAELMYNHGLTNVAQVSEDIDWVKNRTFYVSLGYMFTVGGESEQLP